MRNVRLLVVLVSLLPVAAFAQKSGSTKMPQVVVAGIRVVGAGFGANGSELHAFNEQPGTTISLAIQAPEGSGIVEIDDHASRVDALTDDKGRNLLEEGRFGPFPKLSEDRSAAVVEVEVRGRPTMGASSLKVQGSVAMTVATGTKKNRLPAVRLEEGKTMKLGSTTITLKQVTPGEDATEISLALPRSTMNNIHAVRFFDAKGEEIESDRTSSGYINESAEMGFNLKTKQKSVSVEFETWQNTRQLKVPFTATAGLGLTGDAGPVASAAPASKAAAPPPPPPPSGPVTIGPNDGAASVDAVVKQMQNGFTKGNGRDILAVIHPNDRGQFGQIMATIVTFSILANMDDQKAAEKSQKDIDALFKKHQVKTPLNQDPKIIFKNTDLGAFVTDTIAYMKTHVPKGATEADVLPSPKGKPQNVKITGDTAVADLDGKPITFARVSNKWFVRVTE